jgi:hypothetical protein
MIREFKLPLDAIEGNPVDNNTHWKRFFSKSSKKVCAMFRELFTNHSWQDIKLYAEKVQEAFLVYANGTSLIHMADQDQFGDLLDKLRSQKKKNLVGRCKDLPNKAVQLIRKIQRGVTCYIAYVTKILLSPSLQHSHNLSS